MIRRLYDRMHHHAMHWKGEILFMIELMKHKDVPRLVKILVFTLLSYIFSPIDLIPDFIPIFGHWDDLLAIPLVMYVVNKITPILLIEEIRAAIVLKKHIPLFQGWGPKIAAATVLVIWVAISAFFMYLLGIDSHFSFL